MLLAAYRCTIPLSCKNAADERICFMTFLRSSLPSGIVGCLFLGLACCIGRMISTARSSLSLLSLILLRRRLQKDECWKTVNPVNVECQDCEHFISCKSFVVRNNIMTCLHQHQLLKCKEKTEVMDRHL